MDNTELMGWIIIAIAVTHAAILIPLIWLNGSIHAMWTSMIRLNESSAKVRQATAAIDRIEYEALTARLDAIEGILKEMNHPGSG